MGLNIKTKEFQEVCKTISMATDNVAANLELVTKNNILYLNVTNSEYFCSCKFLITEPENFRAVVDATLFLNLISGLTSETFELVIDVNSVIIKAGKSTYKAPMIFEDDKLMELKEINLENKTVEMQIKKTVLNSILNINSKEVQKANKLQNVNELQKLYYITDSGCFTFTTSACLNKFTLDKPVKMLLNDRIVRLFKLFKTDVNFALAHDPNQLGDIQTKVSFEADNIYLSAIITNDDFLLNKVQRPCEASQALINMNYNNVFVVRTNTLAAAVNRLVLFTKNSVADLNALEIPITIVLHGDDFILKDSLGNEEYVPIENKTTFVDTAITTNLADLKLVLDTCAEDFVTVNCGSNNAIVITHDTASNLLMAEE